MTYATEREIEDYLTANPEEIEPGLTLIARQPKIGSGRADLIGIDKDGRLVIVELKADALARDAVAQAVEYAAWFHNAGFDDITNAIASSPHFEHIEPIANLPEWYRTHFSGRNVNSLFPPRIVLVGDDPDSTTQRIVEFLVEHGIRIKFLNSNSLEANAPRAPALEVKQPLRCQPPRTSGTNEERLDQNIDHYGVSELFSVAHAMLTDQLPNLTPVVYPVGIFYVIQEDGRKTNYIGLDVNRSDKGSINLIVFKDASNLIGSDALAPLRSVLNEQPGSDGFYKGFDTLFKITSLEQWGQHRPAIAVLAANLNSKLQAEQNLR